MSGPPSHTAFQRSGSNINEPDSGFYVNSGPHLSTAVMRGNGESQDSQRDLDDFSEVQTAPPTFTELNRPEKSNPGNYSGSFDSAPGLDGHVRFHDSKLSDLTHVKNQVSAPGLTDQVHKNQSMAADDDDEVAVSLVGGTFKEVNPTAYYVERK